MKIKFLKSIIIVAVFVIFGCQDNNLKTNISSESQTETVEQTQDNIYFDYLYENNAYTPSDEILEATGFPIVRIQTLDESLIDSKTEWKEMSFVVSGSFCGYEDLEISGNIKGRGNTTWNFSKKSYSIKLDSKSKILGMKKNKRWVLLANQADKSLLRNSFFSYLGNNIYKEEWNPSFKTVHLFINDEYRGVYLLGEQIKIDENRVNVTDISKIEPNDEGDYDGGFIFEIDGRYGEVFNFTTSHGVPICLKDPDEVNEQTWQFAKSIIQTAENALFSDSFEDSELGYSKYFDIDSIVDWYIMNELGKNVDAAFFSSIYFYYNPTDKLLHMGPSWDFDLSCGKTNVRGCDNSDGLYIKEFSVWIKRMFDDPAFEERVCLRWNSTKDDLYCAISMWLPEQGSVLKDAAECNFTKWQILGNYIWPYEPAYQQNTTYQSEIDYLENWLENRYLYLDREFSNN